MGDAEKTKIFEGNGSMTKDQVFDLIENFENKLLCSVEYQYRFVQSNIKELILQNHLVNSFDIRAYYQSCADTEYSKDRLDRSVLMLMDIKLEMFFIQFDLAVENRMMPSQDDQLQLEGYQYYQELLRLNFNQSLIVKSRILWERVMNFVYYFETGIELQAKKSKMAKFFKLIENDTNNKWFFLTKFRKNLEDYDDTWRTPEVHKSSTLRSHFLNNSFENDFSNKILMLINIVSNAFYPNLINILNNKPVVDIWVYGMDKNLIIDDPGIVTLK